jgi:hypothetical protein
MRQEQAPEKRSHEMTQYLSSFLSGAMDHIPAEEFPTVGEAAPALTRRPRSSTEGSRSSTCPLGRPPWSGPRRSRPPAAVLKRSASSCPTQRSATERGPNRLLTPKAPEQTVAWESMLSFEDHRRRRRFFSPLPRRSKDPPHWRTRWRTSCKAPANRHVLNSLENRRGPIGHSGVRIPPPPLPREAA